MRILITGKHSYIGSSVKAWLNEKEPSFNVDEISLRNVDLKNITFNNYDVIFHVAGIAHISLNQKMIPEYFRINRDLAIEVAKKAKLEGVKQFIFTSTIAIFGDDRPIGEFSPIDIDKPTPTNTYGQSKMDADLAIQKLQDLKFKVSILRIPMIYGKTAKGNFLNLVKISKRIPIFPKINNFRSVLHVNNLSEFVRLIISNKISGVFYPQDHKYFNTTSFIVNYRKKLNKKTFLIPFISYPLKFTGLFIPAINKVYGNKFYEKGLSIIKNLKYQIYSIEDTIDELKDI